MQNPPGPPAQPPAAASSGMDKRTAALLSYLITWITGLIFLFVAKNDPDVKYHAAQSVVFFGGLSVLIVVINIVTGIVHALGFLGILSFLLWLYGFVMWIVCLVQSFSNNGARFEIPLVG